MKYTLRKDWVSPVGRRLKDIMGSFVRISVVLIAWSAIFVRLNKPPIYKVRFFLTHQLYSDIGLERSRLVQRLRLFDS